MSKHSLKCYMEKEKYQISEKITPDKVNNAQRVQYS